MSRAIKIIDERMKAWVERQRIFFVATAPKSETGHVNCSPKGRDTLRILGPTTIAYLDNPGSGVETIAHLRENGRIVMMLCAFDGPPKIVRFHGHGRVVDAGSTEFQELLPLFQPQVSVRSIIKVDVTRISESCGFGVPLYEYEGERTNTEDFTRKMPDEKIREYGYMNNRRSIDGLNGLTAEEAACVLIDRSRL